jgi:hypothetical protein
MICLTLARIVFNFSYSFSEIYRRVLRRNTDRKTIK